MKCPEKASPQKQEIDWWLPGAQGQRDEAGVLNGYEELNCPPSDVILES